MGVIIKETREDGIFEAFRREGEPPFAQLRAPRAVRARVLGDETARDNLIPSTYRRWVIVYRNPDAQDPFGHNFNLSKPSFAEAEREFEQIVKICNSHQLGLDSCG